MNIRKFYTAVLTLVLTITIGLTTINIDSRAAESTGTFSKGGIFTSEIRAFLDAIAKHEAEGDHYALASYNSGNFTENDFDAFQSYDTRPYLKSGGYTQYGSPAFNIGRYQYYSSQYTMGDINSANYGLKLAGINYTITNFQPTSQDHYPIGKYAMRAEYLKKKTYNLQTLLSQGDAGLTEAIGVGAGEWSSFPYVSGYSHVNTGEALWSLQEFKDYYYQRLDYYNRSGGTNTVVTQSLPAVAQAVVYKPEVAKEEPKYVEPKSVEKLFTPINNSPKYITFKSQSDNGKCMDLNNSWVSDYNSVQLVWCNNTNAQKWILAKNQYANSYQIQSSINNRFCLDINSYDYSLPAILIYCSNANSQWVLGDNGEMKPTINQAFCLTQKRQRNWWETQQLQLQFCNGNVNQKWNY